MYGHNFEPIDDEWLNQCGVMRNELIEVRPIAIHKHFDAIEIWFWNVMQERDGIESQGLMVMHRFPITKGDVRNLCAALEVPCLG